MGNGLVNKYTKQEMVNKIVRETDYTEPEINKALKFLRKHFDPYIILNEYRLRGIYGLQNLYERARRNETWV